MEIVEV